MIYNILNKGGEVINTIVATEQFVKAHYPNQYQLVGPEPPVDVAAVISKAAFRFRLTNSEYVAILAAAKSDVEVQAWLETFNIVSKVDLKNSHTKEGMGLLVDHGILTEERSVEILTTPVADDERA
jgi:hypothetical protein